MYKVCFADDEPLIFKVLNALVDWKSLGYQIAGTATDGAEALSLYEKEKPDLFIIDIRMPLLDGLSCIKQIREKDQKIKIVLLTASDSFEAAQEALNLGANGYLLKPVSRDAIGKIISKITAELNQYAESSKKTLNENDILQKDLKRLYTASENPEENYDWINNSPIFQDQYGLADIFFSSTHYESSTSAMSAAEDLLDRLQIPVHACYFSEGSRILYLTTAMEPKDMEFISLSPDMSLYLFPRLGSDVDPYALLLGMHANRVHHFYYPLNWAGPFITPVSADGGILSASGTARAISLAIRELSIDVISRFLQHIFLRAQNELFAPRQIQIFCYNIVVQLRAQIEELGLLQRNSDEDNIDIEQFLNMENASDLLRYTQLTASEYLESIAGKEEYSKNKAIIIKANTYALENFHDPDLSLENVAEYVGLSKNYFIRLYGKETGISFWSYITDLRISRAKLLLRNTQLSMQDICIQIGYDDVSYFSKKFKTEVGM